MNAVAGREVKFATPIKHGVRIYCTPAGGVGCPRFETLSHCTRQRHPRGRIRFLILIFSLTEMPLKEGCCSDIS